MSSWSEQVSDGAVLLTVNQRLSRHHLHQYQQWQQELGNSWWETPTILPFKGWMVSLHRQALGMGLTNKVLVPKLLVKQAWRQIIESDDSVYLLDQEGATGSAVAAWEQSCAWQCFNNDEHYLSADQYAWQRWMTRYREWLDSQLGIDEALLTDELHGILGMASDEQRSALLPDSLILDGFLQLPAQLDDFLMLVQSYGTKVQVCKPETTAVVQELLHDDDDMQLRSIASQMRNELEHDPQQSLGLVIPDLAESKHTVLRAFERVFFPGMSPAEIHRQTPAFEISLGNSLADQPVVSAALLFIQLSGASINGSDISAALLSPYWRDARVDARRREQQDRRWRDKRIRQLTLPQFANELDKGSKLGPLLSRLLAQRRLGKAHLSDWARRFSEWLNILGWPGKSRNSVEHQGYNAWHECLDDMQLLDDGKQVSFMQALTQLKALTAEQVFQAETPKAPIQVIGRLESHGLPFDCLWVVGFDSGQWPPSGSPNAFLSIQEQKACQIPASSAALRLELAEKEFALWASQAPLMFACYVASRDGNEVSRASIPVLKSSSANQLQAIPRLERYQQMDERADPVQHLRNTLTVETVPDFYGPQIQDGAKVGGGARLFENQALCPFRAFALHRLGIRPLEEVGIGLDPRQHGTLLHAALEEFWKLTQTHEALMSLDEEALVERVHLIVDQCIDDYGVPGELRTLEFLRLTRLLHEWIVQLEKPREPFEVVHLEQKLSIEHGGISMDIIIDRIDKVGDALLVIDYKTGTSNRISSWADTRISNPQLPLYVLTDDDIAAASFAQVASNQHRFIGIASASDLLPKVGTKLTANQRASNAGAVLTQWKDWREHWQSSLDNIAEELLAGVATITPMKNACTYCELNALCRFKPGDEEALEADPAEEMSS